MQRLPPNLLVEPRSGLEPIDYTLLRQRPRTTHIIGEGDVLGIHVQDVLTEGREPPPVTYPSISEKSRLETPAVGAPISVRADGMISVPLVDPIRVQGLTLLQATAAIRNAYTEDGKILKAGRDYVSVTLIRPRTKRVLVLREDSPTPIPTLRNVSATILSKHGSAQVVELVEGENDVLHALIATGGLPGVDARNEVLIMHSGSSTANNWNSVVERLDGGLPSTEIMRSLGTTHTTRIPLRVACNEPLPFSEDDVVLREGDVVFVPSRDDEVYYVGGLLNGGQLPLPRDYDLDVLGAIALANGSVGGPAGINSAATNFVSGPGNIVPPTRVIVIRKYPSGDQLRIYVNLKRALHDSRERLLIQPEDIVILQYTPLELATNVALNFVNVGYAIPND